MKSTDPPPYFRPDKQSAAAAVAKQRDFLIGLHYDYLAYQEGNPVQQAQSYASQLKQFIHPKAFMDRGGLSENAVDRFQRFTAGWRPRHIGPIRTLYYIQCLETVPGGEGFKFPPESGGYTRPQQPYGNNDWLFFAKGGRACGFDAVQWLIRDRYLANVLKVCFGLTWSDVEAAACAAFRHELPPTLRLRYANVPDPTMLWLWKSGLEKWQQYEREGRKIEKDAHRFLMRAQDLALAAHAVSSVRILLNEIQPPDWTHLVGKELPPYCHSKSPIIKSVLLAIHDTLWKKIPSLEEVHKDAPEFFVTIAKERQQANPHRATVLWMLITDLALHLSVCLGLPEPASPLSGDPKHAVLLTADRVGQRLRPLVDHG